MKRFLCIALCLATLFAFSACGSKEETPARSTPILSNWKSEGEYPTIHAKFTRESLNDLPMKRTDMTEDEMRRLVVDFMYFSKNQALYTPSEAYKYEITPIYPDEFKKDTIYSGPAFMNTGCGNIYRLLDIMDEETGVLNMTDLKANIDLFSNTGPSACYWAWGRVCSSIGYSRLANMTHANGYLRVGPYTYSDNLTAFTETDTTVAICAQNGLVTMCQSYAAAKPADAMITSTAENTQMFMVAKDVSVVYYEGTDIIDPNASFVTYIDQNYIWGEAQNDQGDTYLRKNNVESTHTFMDLFNKGYIPFTTAELNGTKPVEETKAEISLSGDTITTDDIFSAAVTCNFGISDAYITIKNENGDVYRHTVRATQAGVKELKLSLSGNQVFTEGSLETISGEFTVEISVQLSTGERPTLYTGKIKL